MLSFQTFLETPTKEGGTGVPPVVVNQDHAQDARATLKKRRGAHLPHWTLDGAWYVRLIDKTFHRWCNDTFFTQASR